MEVAKIQTQYRALFDAFESHKTDVEAQIQALRELTCQNATTRDVIRTSLNEILSRDPLVFNFTFKTSQAIWAWNLLKAIGTIINKNFTLENKQCFMYIGIARCLLCPPEEVMRQCGIVKKIMSREAVCSSSAKRVLQDRVEKYGRKNAKTYLHHCNTNCQVYETTLLDAIEKRNLRIVWNNFTKGDGQAVKMGMLPLVYPSSLMTILSDSLRLGPKTAHICQVYNSRKLQKYTKRMKTLKSENQRREMLGDLNRLQSASVDYSCPSLQKPHKCISHVRGLRVVGRHPKLSKFDGVGDSFQKVTNLSTFAALHDHVNITVEYSPNTPRYKYIRLFRFDAHENGFVVNSAFKTLLLMHYNFRNTKVKIPQQLFAKRTEERDAHYLPFRDLYNLPTEMMVKNIFNEETRDVFLRTITFLQRSDFRFDQDYMFLADNLLDREMLKTVLKTLQTLNNCRPGYVKRDLERQLDDYVDNCVQLRKKYSPHLPCEVQDDVWGTIERDRVQRENRRNGQLEYRSIESFTKQARDVGMGDRTQRPQRSEEDVFRDHFNSL